MTKVGKAYSQASLVFLNTVVIVVLSNFVLWGLYELKDAVTIYRQDRALETNTYYGSAIKQVYPGMNDEEIFELLKETWSRPITFKPLVQFTEAPFTGRYVNVDPAGYRKIEHQEAWPPDPKDFNIFVFGGSTTFGYGVADWQSVPSYLQEGLRSRSSRKTNVYNFGVGAYYSTQEMIVYQSLVAQGYVPSLAMFIDGANDFAVQDNAPEFSTQLRRLMNQADRPSSVTALGVVIHELPMYRLAQSMRTHWQHHQDPASDFKVSNEDDSKADRDIKTYLANKRMIEAVGLRYDVKTVFVWEPIPIYHYDLSHHLFSGGLVGLDALSRLGYQKMHETMLDPVHQLDLADFIWAADIAANSEEPLYVDAHHYTAVMSQRIADLIVDELLARKIP